MVSRAHLSLLHIDDCLAEVVGAEVPGLRALNSKQTFIASHPIESSCFLTQVLYPFPSSHFMPSFSSTSAQCMLACRNALTGRNILHHMARLSTQAEEHIQQLRQQLLRENTLICDFVATFWKQVPP